MMKAKILTMAAAVLCACAAFAAKEVCVNHPDATSAVLAVLNAVFP